jgi:hypothetical protein
MGEETVAFLRSAERQQFPHHNFLSPDNDQFGWNVSWKLLKWLAFIDS